LFLLQVLNRIIYGYHNLRLSLHLTIYRCYYSL